MITSKCLLVTSKRSGTSFKCTGSLASVCWLLRCHPAIACKTGKEQAIKPLDRELNFMQCPISIHIVCHGRWYVQLVRWCPSVQCYTNLIFDSDCFIFASTVSAYSLWQTLLRVLAPSSTRSSHNTLYDRCSSTFHVVFHEIWAVTYLNMREWFHTSWVIQKFQSP